MKKKTLLFSSALCVSVFCNSQSANQTLSNLTSPVAVNKDLRPGSHNAYNLGEPSKSWKNLSITGIVYHNSEPFLKVSPTGGLFLGTNAGSITTGLYNTGIGFMSLRNNTTGSYNTSGGFKTLYSNSSGINNTAGGYMAMFSNISGNNNTVYGGQALYKNTAGNANTATGYQALFSNTTGSGNSATGSQALYSNTDGSSNTANGSGALSANTYGNSNTATGSGALGANTYGIENTATGTSALTQNIDGSYNTAVGTNAAGRNISGVSNTAIGNYALLLNETGYYNTAIGVTALSFSMHASNNTAVGNATMILNQNGENNTALGCYAGNVTADGAIQYDANVSACTFLGANATVGYSNQYNTTVIGYNAWCAGDNQVVIGNTSVNSIGGYSDWTNFSDGRYKQNVKENVPGLAFINELRAVTYTLDIAGVNKVNPAVINPKNPRMSEHLNIAGEKGSRLNNKDQELAAKAVSEKSKILYTGFLAQEVEKAAKKINYDFSGVKKPVNSTDFYGLRYAEFVVPLVKAVQELSSENNELKIQNKTLEARLTAIEQQLGNKNNSLGIISLEKNTLGQSMPNPANGKINIPFNLSPSIKHANIVITETASGKLLKLIEINSAGKNIMVELTGFSSGAYTYSLIANNKTLDSKQMIIVR